MKYEQPSRWYQDPLLWPLLALTVSVKIAAIWSAATVFNHSAWLAHICADIAGWTDFLSKSQQGLIPYVQMTKEYQVGGGLLYWVMSRFLPAHYSFNQLLLVHATFMGVADVVNTAIFYSITKRLNARRAGWVTLVFILTPTAVILSPVRFESYVILTVLIGYYFHLTNRPGWAVFFWSLGWSLKWFPIFFIAAQEVQALFLQKRKAQWLKSAGIFLSVTCVLNLPFILWSYQMLGNANNWLATYLFHLRRPLYWDTLLGIGTLWFGNLRWESYASYWSAFLVLAVLFYRPRIRLEYKAVLICAAVLLLNRIYSPQFHLWFYPFLFFALCLESDRQMRILLSVFAILEALNVLVYPFLFTYALSELKHFAPLAARLRGGVETVLFTLAILLRAVALFVLAWLMALGADRKPAGQTERATIPAAAS